MEDLIAQRSRLKKVINLAGKRYDTAINLRVESVLKYAYAMNREEAYIKELLVMAYALRKNNIDGYLINSNNDKSVELKSINKKVRKLVSKLLSIESMSRDQQIRWSGIVANIDEIVEEIDSLRTHFEDETRPNLDKENPKRESRAFKDLEYSLYDLRDLLNDKRAKLFNTPRMLLRGEAGIGKTHLLCDYASERLERNEPTIMFLGHELLLSQGSVDPIKSISNILGYKRTNDFIKALEDLCARSSSRVCLIIDAINEADQIRWSALSRLYSIKGLSLIISVRNGYDFLIDNTSKYSVVEHTGFSEIEWEAIPKFFEYHNLKLPEIPVIDPEFKNPLFLKLFCESYSGSKKTPKGRGATHVFEIYVEKQSAKIIEELGLNVPKDYLWKNVIKKTGIWMGSNGKNRIQRSKILSIIESNSVLKPHASSLIRLMEHDGLLLKYPHYSKNYRRSGYEYMFTYHRFSDHLIIRSVLTENGIEGRGATDRAKLFFRNTKFLDRSIRNADSGLIEALAVQIPERCKGDELISLIPKKFLELSIIKNAFIEGLKWRDLSTTKDGSLKSMNETQVLGYMNTYMSRTDEDMSLVVECMFDVSAVPLHPFNAKRLNKFLQKFSLADRDAWFQEFTLERYDTGRVINRLHSWSLSKLPSSASDESILLASIALTWTLSSSNRSVRDNSSRALVALLTNRLGVAYELIANYFLSNNDPYVTERLFGIIYGAVYLSEKDVQGFRQIVNHLYNSYFKDGKRPPNAMQDDYAKNIIELYLRKNKNDLHISTKVITPPYNYNFPKRTPTVASLKTKYHDSSDDYYSIWSSLMYGDAAIADFGNYTLSSRLRGFSSFKIGQMPALTEYEKYQNFINKLTLKQSRLLDVYNSLHHVFLRSSILEEISEGGLRTFNIEFEDKDGHDIALKKFIGSLGPLRRFKYGKYKGYITGDKDRPSRIPNEFDLNLARRWIFNRVIKLGWDPKKHLPFERYYARDGMNRTRSVKTERIGKKYQWIGLFEATGIIASNYYLIDDSNWNIPKYILYQNATQTSLRDFDPTINPRWLNVRKGQSMVPNGWWIPTYDGFNANSWKTATEDVPSPKELINVSKDNKDYLNLLCQVTWKGENDPPGDSSSSNYPELWMHINAYIVRKQDMKTVKQWCSDKEFYNHILPEPNEETSGVFFKEFEDGSSSSYKNDFYPNYGRSDWIKANTDVPFDHIVPVEAYTSHHFESDGSLGEHFTIYMPNDYLRKSIGLTPTSEIGVFESVRYNITMFDPSVNEIPGRQTLLVNKAEFLSWLDENDLTIIWSVLGEKTWIGSREADAGRGKRLEVHGYCYYDENGSLIEDVRFKNN